MSNINSSPGIQPDLILTRCYNRSVSNFEMLATELTQRFNSNETHEFVAYERGGESQGDLILSRELTTIDRIWIGE
jgi:hypothetical protein